MRIFEGFQKGVNLGGWISQYERYDVHHFDTFITREDIASIAGLGFDHVRVPVDYIVLEDEEGNLRESGFAYLENCRRWCEEFGLHMLIDLHECYGYSFDPLKKGMDRRIFFYDEALQARFLRLWEEIARRFAAYPEQVAFEPLNEVTLQSVWEAWNALVRRYIETIRAIAPRSWIVIGGVLYNHVSSVKLLDKPYDDRVVYNFHCYEPFLFTHQSAYWVEKMPKDFHVQYPLPLAEYRRLTREVLHEEDSVIFNEQLTALDPSFFDVIFADAVAAAERYDAPLYCGEYGAIDLADGPSKINWLRDIHTAFNKYGIGRALWNYKEKDFGFVDDAFRDIRDAFIEVL